jgi:CheY-like chemotaxis protein
LLPKIMIVEDDPAIREIYMLKFELEGYKIHGAANGQEALDALANFKPDFILLDLMMPVMGGAEFLRRFQLKNLPSEVIVFTNFSAADQDLTLTELGIAEYWVKSDFTPELVISRIESRWTDRNGQ